jgi:NAD(P)-dependent dehydrogenase (short-subunit alcohol dehydrogenase family)
MADPVCVVTGGAGDGIGGGICRVVAQAGYVVVVADLDEDGARRRAHQLDADGYRSAAVRLDVTDPDQVAQVFADVPARWGRLDGLVNSAGIGLVKPAADITVEEWTRLVDTDLRGAWLCAKAAIPLMVDAGGGSIVNIGSVQAIGPHVGFAVYSAAKAGLVGLTRGIAADYGRVGIRCNVVHPGLVDGDQSRRILEAMGYDAQAWIDTYLTTRQMLPIAISAEDIGATVAFLLGPHSRSVTGAEFVVDAGASVMAFDRDPMET